MITKTMTALPADASLPEKIEWLEDRYVRLDRDDALIARLGRLFKTDKEGQLTPKPKIDRLNGETRGLMLIGESGAGKSSLLRRTLRTVPMIHLADRENDGNTFYVTVPPEATIKSFASRIAKKLGYLDMNSRANADQAWDVARHRMRERGVRLLVIDEAHHLLRKGSGRDVEGAIQRLKSLLQGDWPVAVIAAGVDKLRQGVMTDPETDRRFPRFQLTRIAEGSKEARTFARSMQLCAEKVGLSLDGEAMPDRVLFAENGEPGRAIHLAKTILVAALEEGRSKVTLRDAGHVFSREYGAMQTTPFAEAPWDTVRVSLTEAGWSR
ncbi:TniB family NTP-binding protein [Pseudooceanicola algae]|uniref:AAA+ ATPase domain-containing protein n=1 Tax=Pseudooceanicola algae TaxID=1537215 RepID=A0A418SBC5_9RHOB|nr:TniB family NTP-binding protein [Pseudooceanicola algae]QPM91417.1 hypothetical protein PSAL_026700 [Pseudooceanicola algae]